MANTPTGVVAVLTAYWPERHSNLILQIGDLLMSSIVPDKIIVFNNNPDILLPPLPQLDRIAVIESNKNFTSRAKYSIALLEPSPYYILLDDDISVSKTDIENYLSYAKPGYALCDWGVNFKEGSPLISQGRGYLSSMVRHLTPVDSFIGRAQFVSFGAIVKMLEAEERCRLPFLPEYGSTAEDILMALCNPEAYVCPKIRPIVLPTGGVAMESDEGYQEFRDLFTISCLVSMGRRVVGGVPEKHEKKAGVYLDLMSARGKGRAPSLKFREAEDR